MAIGNSISHHRGWQTAEKRRALFVRPVTTLQGRSIRDWLCGTFPRVYFVQGVDGGRIKIGTSSDLLSRLSSLQASSPIDLRLLGLLENDQRATPPTERALHERFADLRAHGEWFEPGDDLVSYIHAETASIDLSIVDVVSFICFVRDHPIMGARL